MTKAPTMRTTARYIIESDGPMALDTFVQRIGIERTKARKLLSNLCEAGQVAYAGTTSGGVYRTAE